MNDIDAINREVTEIADVYRCECETPQEFMGISAEYGVPMRHYRWDRDDAPDPCENDGQLYDIIFDGLAIYGWWTAKTIHEFAIPEAFADVIRKRIADNDIYAQTANGLMAALA